MIREIKIENYKSIQQLKLRLGRVTVFIGENGCGKSNILEATALASAAANDKLDNEFLASRGIRVTEPQFMRSAFEHSNITQEIKISLEANSQTSLNFSLQNDNQPYSNWFEKNYIHFKHLIGKKTQEYIQKYLEEYINENTQKEQLNLYLKKFLIYSPENLSLRTFEKEGQIQPLGIKGEGLFKLLKILSLDKNQDRIYEIKEKLKLIDWFQDFEMPRGLAEIEKNVQIKDKYLDSDIPYFDQRSSNEGFLFLMFYFALFISDDTPKFFAIDNIDASLNPKLCSQLIKELVKMAEKYDKQAIFTTHNPAVLDGLNLDDDEQRLFVIYRNKLGHTKAKRILKPEPLEGQKPIKLSEAFMKGYIGGLPKGF
ncbi:AAA family ATPase [Allocoleopsis franciscana]|uniref:Putative ATPase n=1 Tax=Allocoleopsis franciscana PCC 7113 TaxID=1173027 RepID=K9WB46_9CYAN|nr:AAA family ATPase [Allocoleopsis franciscana]AFZ17036.1 putative ATPase [Allocoleopsis franciscana PCC 7113]